MAISKKRLAELLFVDIETVGLASKLGLLPFSSQKLWSIKAKQIGRNIKLSNREVANLYEERAGIYSEFAKVVCISVGFFYIKKGKILSFRTKSFVGEEVDILQDFITLLKTHFDKPANQGLCGHNIREFDIPFLCRRMTIHRLKLPRMLDIAGKKPWEIGHLVDTLHLWRFGDYKHYTSLALLADVFDIPSPKDDIDGSDIHRTYWEEEDVDRIAVYCEKDVFTVAKVFCRMAPIDLPEALVMEKA